MKLIFAVYILLCNTHLTAQSKIVALEAKLFYNQNKEEPDAKNAEGGFSENIIGNANFPLFNTIIGGGAAEGYSNQTIVIVTVSSTGFSNKDQLIRLTATTGKKLLLKQEKTFSVLGDKVNYQVLFLIENTGCDIINLQVSLLRKNKPVSTLKKKIEFHCGE